SRLKFSITFILYRPLYLLILLLSRAFIDNAFFKGYRTIKKLLPLNYQLREERDKVLIEPIVLVKYYQYRDIWNRTLLITGILRNPQSYLMKVDIAGRLDSKQLQIDFQ
ncbi:hypothetical protein B0J13DRAFT_447421, partial [Dactylonectria estremocensis]